MKDCIFCKIVSGEIPSKKVYEDGDFLSFLDIRPLNPGHILIVPKKHFRWVWDVPNIGAYYEIVGKLAKVLKKTFDTEQIVSLVFGEEVPHAHIWLVPRFEGDGHGTSIDTKNFKNISEEELAEIQSRIKNQI
ncbi:HIT family protein [Candidatus Parcubacteria bacterium]|nr:MAG: HIT family protein [Candidatus Parcubacteria bacterium]